MLTNKILLIAALIGSFALASQASAMRHNFRPDNFRPDNFVPQIQINDDDGPKRGGPRTRRAHGPLAGPITFNRNPLVQGFNPNRRPQGQGGQQFRAPQPCGPKTKIPDGGMTFAMLGTALTGLAFVKRKKKNA